MVKKVLAGIIVYNPNQNLVLLVNKLIKEINIQILLSKIKM